MPGCTCVSRAAATLDSGQSVENPPSSAHNQARDVDSVWGTCGFDQPQIRPLPALVQEGVPRKLSPMISITGEVKIGDAEGMVYASIHWKAGAGREAKDRGKAMAG